MHKYKKYNYKDFYKFSSYPQIYFAERMLLRLTHVISLTFHYRVPLKIIRLSYCSCSNKSNTKLQKQFICRNARKLDYAAMYLLQPQSQNQSNQSLIIQLYFQRYMFQARNNDRIKQRKITLEEEAKSPLSSAPMCRSPYKNF